MEGKGYLSNVCLCTFLLELTSHFQLCPAFWQIRGGQRTLPVPIDSQLPSNQNNPYAHVACFETLLFNWKDQKSSKPHRSKASICSHKEPPLRSSSQGGSQNHRSHGTWPVFIPTFPSLQGIQEGSSEMTF